MYGAWLQLDLPYKITLDYIIIQPRVAQVFEPEATPGAGNIWGSNDGMNWNLLASFTGFTYGGTTHAGLPETAQVNSTTPYSYFRLQPTQRSGTYGTDSFVSIGNLSFFGTPETTTKYSTLHDGELTLTKSLNVPRIGPALDADDTPRRDRLIVEYNTSTNPTFDGAVRDTSGRGNDGIMYNGASYDATQKALVFDGTDDYINVRHLRNVEYGDIPYAISIWLKPASGTTTDWRAFFAMGIADRNGTHNNGLSWGNNIGDEISMYYPSNSTYYTVQNGGGSLSTATGLIHAGKWDHVVSQYDGKRRYIYVNGNLEATDDTFTGMNLPPDMVLNIGRNTNTENGSEFADFSMSNFKWWLGASLTPEEVKTLYDMGRNGSVVKPQPLHIAAPLYAPGTICQVGIVDFPRINFSISSGQTKTLTTFNFKPKFANSRLFFTLTIYCETGSLYWNIWLYRNDSDRITSHTTGNYGITGQNYSGVGGGHQVRVGQAYDEPNTTEYQKYSVKFVNSGGSTTNILGIDGPHLLKIEEICQ